MFLKWRLIDALVLTPRGVHCTVGTEWIHLRGAREVDAMALVHVAQLMLAGVFELMSAL